MGSNETTESSGFLNPYQFVSDQPWPKDPVNDDLKPLVRSRYISHQRPPKEAISGVITCQLETKTPILIAQHGDNGLEFVKNADRIPYLPASSLRGAIRTVFEAATNSCYTFPERKDELIFYRNTNLSQTKRIVPGIIQKDKNGELIFHPLPGSEELQVYNGTNQTKRDYAAWIVRYAENNIQGRKLFSEPLQHGKLYFVILKKTVHEKNSKNGSYQIPIWAVEQISDSELHLDPNSGNQYKVEQGYYYQTSYHQGKKKNFSLKHDERFFFAAKDSYPWSDLLIEKEILNRYDQLLKESEKRLLEKASGHFDGMSDFVPNRQNWELKVGSLVYGVYDPDFKKLIDLVPVLVPRLAYQHSYRDLVPDDHHHCTSIDALCPACRVFGWVKGSKEEQGNQVGYASRINFTDGLLATQFLDKWDSKRVTRELKPLGPPHPSAVGFYLRQNNTEKNFTWRNHEEPPYDRQNALKIRGRKLYYRHANPSNVLNQATATEQDKKTYSIKMIQSAEFLTPSLTFEFQIQFKNLLPVELGALLWSLQLEEGMFHQIGYGKPFGFGSIKIRVTRLVLKKNNWYWQDNGTSHGDEDATQGNPYIERYRNAIEQLYNQKTKTFSEVSFINNLKQILGNARKLPIHYPRPSMQPGNEFKWFMNNKQKNNGVAWLPVTVGNDELRYSDNFQSNQNRNSQSQRPFPPNKR